MWGSWSWVRDVKLVKAHAQTSLGNCNSSQGKHGRYKLRRLAQLTYFIKWNEWMATRQIHRNLEIPQCPRISHSFRRVSETLMGFITYQTVLITDHVVDTMLPKSTLSTAFMHMYIEPLSLYSWSSWIWNILFIRFKPQHILRRG